MTRLQNITIVFLIWIVYCGTISAQQDNEQIKCSTGLNPNIEKTKNNITAPICGSSFNASGYVEEGFESANFPPIGWITKNVLGDRVWSRSFDNPNSGAASAYIKYETDGGEDWLITRKIPLGVGANLTFYIRKHFSSSYYGDDLTILISTTDTNISSFKYQVANISLASLTSSGYNKFYFSLNAFAGKFVHVAFKHANVDGYGCYLDDIKIGTPPVNDAGMLSIDVNEVVSELTFTPKVTVKNYGSGVNSFNVTLNIGDIYSSVKTINNLPGDSTTQVEFDNINLDHGEYNISCYTQLVTDNNKSNDTLIKKIMAITKTGLMGYNTHSSSIQTGTVKFCNTNPEQIDNLFGITTTDYLAGSAFVPHDKIYSIFSVTNEFVSMDTLTGTLTSLGTLYPLKKTIWTGLTYDPVSKIMYGVVAGEINSYLVQIDFNNLTGSTIGTIPNTTIIGIAANGDGNIYWVDIIANTFGKFNLTTQEYSIIAPLGFNANYAQSLEFDYSTGILYYASNSMEAGSQLRIIDINTGSTMLVGDFEGNCEIDGLVIPTSLPSSINTTNNIIPDGFSLNQNYPNPFNPATTISYSLAGTSYIKLIVTNIIGQEVDIPINEQQQAGTYSFNFDAKQLSSGVYFYTLIAQSSKGEVFKSVKKMLVLK